MAACTRRTSSRRSGDAPNSGTSRRERSANESVARECSEHSEIEHDVDPDAQMLSADPTPDPRESREDAGESSDDDLPITAQEAHDIVRIMLMASATAVPQARWIGERLLDPYGAKFQRHRLGVPFNKEVVGGLDEPDGRCPADEIEFITCMPSLAQSTAC